MVRNLVVWWDFGKTIKTQFFDHKISMIYLPKWKFSIQLSSFQCTQPHFHLSSCTVLLYKHRASASSNVKPEVSQWTASLWNDVIFLTVNCRIYCRKCFSLSYHLICASALELPTLLYQNRTEQSFMHLLLVYLIFKISFVCSHLKLFIKVRVQSNKKKPLLIEPTHNKTNKMTDQSLRCLLNG